MITHRPPVRICRRSLTKAMPGHQLRWPGSGAGARPVPLAGQSHAATIQSGYVDRDCLEFRRLAGSPEQWASAVAVNNHFDTDGVLSVWTLLDPERALAQRDLLVAAAEAGDFDEWPALDRGLWLDAAIRALGSGRAMTRRHTKRFWGNFPS